MCDTILVITVSTDSQLPSEATIVLIFFSLIWQDDDFKCIFVEQEILFKMGKGHYHQSKVNSMGPSVTIRDLDLG